MQKHINPEQQKAAANNIALSPRQTFLFGGGGAWKYMFHRRYTHIISDVGSRTITQQTKVASFPS